MMPKERSGRGRAVRGLSVTIVGILALLLAIQVWGPTTASSATSAPAASVPVGLASGSAAPGRTAVPGGTAAGGNPSSGAPGSSAGPSLTPSASPDPSVSPLRLQQVLDRTRVKLSIPGVSVAILWDDGRSWVGASGARNIATSDPMTTGTAFAFASISKTFTAAVVLGLVEEGKLSLDQSVAPLLPQFSLDRRITVRMLLDHTSGLPDFFFGKGIDAALKATPNATWTALQSWAYVPAKHATPGRTWYYSNTNYLLLGELVSAVTGNPLAQEVRTRLLDPLGLTTAYYQGVEVPREAGTLAYTLSSVAGGGFRARPVARPSDVMPFRSVVTAAGGAGSIAGTALDAARWMRAYAGGQVLNPQMQSLMLADVARTVKLHAGTPYGLGIQQVTLNGYLALGHSGRYVGIRNIVRYLPTAGITIAVLTNQSLWDPNRIASALLKVVLPTPTPTPAGSAVPSAGSSAPSGAAAPTASPGPS